MEARRLVLVVCALDCANSLFSIKGCRRKGSELSMRKGLLARERANKSFKPFATLTRTPSTPRRVAHGFAIIAQTALRTGRRLTGR